MCMIDDADGYVVELSAARHVARIPHRCAECSRTIQPGETYLREAYVWEGKLTTHKTCRHCAAAREWLARECGGFVYGGVYEDLMDHLCEYGKHADLALTLICAGLSRKWVRRDGKPWRVPRQAARPKAASAAA